ncbi:MAG TPA: hypothetical protein VH257_08090, partial [Chloroflexota bacterium]|nr:hypothetical protein [Chloroflexota bacterium]
LGGLAAGGGLALGAACGGGGGGGGGVAERGAQPSPGLGPARLTLWHHFGGSRIPLMDELSRRFGARYPGVTIEHLVFDIDPRVEKILTAQREAELARLGQATARRIEARLSGARGVGPAATHRWAPAQPSGSTVSVARQQYHAATER